MLFTTASLKVENTYIFLKIFEMLYSEQTPVPILRHWQMHKYRRNSVHTSSWNLLPTPNIMVETILKDTTNPVQSFSLHLSFSFYRENLKFEIKCDVYKG